MSAKASPALGSRTPTSRTGVAHVSANHSQGDWALGLGPKVPVNLCLTCPQGDVTLDLGRLKVPTLNIQHDRGTLHLTLPSTDQTATLARSQGDMVLKLPPNVGVSSLVKTCA